MDAHATTTRADCVMDARSLFPATRGGSIPTSALQLHFCRCWPKRFAACNRQWHSTQPAIGAINTLSPCFAAVFDGQIYAVAAWSNPVARSLPQRTCLELRRFAIAPDAPRNTASRMLAWMTRHIRANHPRIDTVISYQDADVHIGTIYRAAGWTPRKVGGGGAWSNRQRFNRTAVRRPNKIRWQRSVR